MESVTKLNYTNKVIKNPHSFELGCYEAGFSQILTGYEPLVYRNLNIFMIPLENKALQTPYQIQLVLSKEISLPHDSPRLITLWIHECLCTLQPQMLYPS